MRHLDSPASIGPYRLERRLGTGGMGEVFLALDERLDRQVALKRLRSDRPAERNRLRREARALAHLHHSSIVQCFDLLVHGEEEWLVMEYVEGPRLADLVAEGPLPVEQVLEYGRQVAEGLHVAHSRGILHRDLKAENVVVDRSTDRAKILDFGLVRTFGGQRLDAESLSSSGVLVGTIRSVSPEQAMGLRVGPRSDLFSLGVLLYEMVKGISPFSADSPATTLGRILGRHPEPLPPEVPDALDHLVFRLLEKSPESRPRDAAEVVRLLARIEPTPPASEPVASAHRKASASLECSTVDFHPTPQQDVALSAPAASRPRVAPTALAALAGLGALGAILFLGPGLRSGSELVPDADIVRAAREGPALEAPVPEIPSGAAGTELEPLPAAEEGWEALADYGRDGRLAEATRIFRARIEAASDPSADDHSGLARTYWRWFLESSGDLMWLEQAISVGRMAVELAADEAEEARARTSLGLALVERGELEAAREELEGALALDPTDVDSHRGLAEVHQAGQRHEEAEASLDQAIALRPGDHELHDLLGTLYLRLGRYGEAEAAFGRSIELAPELTAGRRNLAAVHIARGELSKAAGLLEVVLERKPTASVYLNLGTVYFFQGLYSRAAEAYERALDSAYGVQQPVAWANLGDAYRQIPQRRREAPRAFRQAIRLLESRFPETGTPPAGGQLSRLALYQAKAELEAEARETLEGFTVDDPRSLLLVATAWEILGERGKALECLAAALEAGLDVAEVQQDPELVALRSDRRFQEILGDLDLRER